MDSKFGGKTKWRVWVSEEDRILIRNIYYFNGCIRVRLINEFPTKRWKRNTSNDFIKCLKQTGLLKHNWTLWSFSFEFFQHYGNGKLVPTNDSNFWCYVIHWKTDLNAMNYQFQTCYKCKNTHFFETIVVKHRRTQISWLNFSTLFCILTTYKLNVYVCIF